MLNQISRRVKMGEFPRKEGLKMSRRVGSKEGEVGMATLKNRIIIPISLILLVMLSSPAWSSVVGMWDIVGTVTVKVSIKGLGSDSGRGPFVDEFVFNPDGTFDMVDMSGSWSQSGSGFIIELDPLEIEMYFEDGLAAGGLDADVTVISTSFKGKESKDGSAIKGKFGMIMDIYIYNLGASG